MAMSPERITEIRELMDSEYRTHDQLDEVVEELLVEVEQQKSDG